MIWMCRAVEGQSGQRVGMVKTRIVSGHSLPGEDQLPVPPQTTPQDGVVTPDPIACRLGMEIEKI